MDVFGTAVNCMDGRVQLPVINFLKENYNVDYVDCITLEGPDKKLSELKDTPRVEAVRFRIGISVNIHNSDVLIMCGHYDCAGNPADEDKHIRQIKESANLIKSWYSEIKVIAAWIDESWKVNILEEY